MTQYGKIDILWYDVDWPLNAEQWESEKMNKMVFELQPDIIVNNRNGLPGDFSTPEQHIEAAKAGRAWETCMTMNDSWGYQKADKDWKSPQTIVRNLIICARDSGKLSVEYRSQARRLGSRGIGSHSDGGGRVDGQERSDDLRRRNPASATGTSTRVIPEKVIRFTCILPLAGRNAGVKLAGILQSAQRGRHRRAARQSQISAAVCFRQTGGL